MTALWDYIRGYAKAIGGLVGSAVASWVALKGYDLSPETVVIITGLVTAFIISVVPNTGPKA